MLKCHQGLGSIFKGLWNHHKVVSVIMILIMASGAWRCQSLGGSDRDVGALSHTCELYQGLLCCVRILLEV